jgi:hypothetical protein
MLIKEANGMETKHGITGKGMNKEEALKQIEELKQYVAQCEKQEKEENYCIGNYKQVKFDDKSKSLIFANGCAVDTRIAGDGIFIRKKYVKKVVDYGNDCLYIYLKGTKPSLNIFDEDKETLLWGEKD